MGSVIIGATKTTQLKNALESCSLQLNPEILKKIDEAHRQYPMPY
jgi:aryl-alcohol dehydrogenase-like predicted oxidoreductase